MNFKVLLTEGARQDLEELYAFVADQDSVSAANHVLDGIEKTIRHLNEVPGRGSHPKELLSLGVKEYRQVFFKPYRIIFRISGDTVYVYLITDGRRDMQTLLMQRLLSGS